MERIRSAVKKLNKKKTAQARSTVVFQSSKKNLAYYDPEIYDRLKQRKQTVITFNERDATPNALTETDLIDVEEQYAETKQKRTSSLWDTLVESVENKTFSSSHEHLEESEEDLPLPDLDEINDEIAGINVSDLFLAIQISKPKQKKTEILIKKPKTLIEISLRLSETFDIFEFVSLIAPKGSKEAEEFAKQSAHYEYVTKGDGVGPRGDAEAQTEISWPMSRSNNTEQPEKNFKETYASNYDIYQSVLESDEMNDKTPRKKISFSTHEDDKDLNNQLGNNEDFQLASMMLERCLSENVYRNRQMMFRNQTKNDSPNLEFLYELKELWVYKNEDSKGKEVVDFSFCPSNGEIMAAAYGIYNYRESKNRLAGAVLVWCIKNPVNPERRYRFKCPVTSISFSNVSPQMLAVGFYDGKVEVIDISESNLVGKDSTVARSERKSSLGLEPVWSCVWNQFGKSEFIFTASQDGRIMKYELGSGPHLIGHQQLRLNRVDGTLDGLAVGVHETALKSADRYSQALCLQFRPAHPTTYMVGTDEGCMHTCSINSIDQHVGVSQAHKYGIFNIEFSPFSPKIFLTTGSDFAIRIWVEDITEPILVLEEGFEGLHCAFWSPSNSTMIVSCTRYALHIWDLRRKNLKPIIRTIGNRNLTVIKFSLCGQSLAVGDTEGDTHLCSLESFPSGPHFKLEALITCLETILRARPDILDKIENVGYLGYRK